MTRTTTPLATHRANLERAVSIFEADRLAVMDLNLARDLLRRVTRWQRALEAYPLLSVIIRGEYAMWAPLIRITIEDADRCLGCGNEARAAMSPTPQGAGDVVGFDPSRGLHILQHSLGVDQYGLGRQYRNHFVTREGSTDHPDCCALVTAGLMVKQRGTPLTGGDDAFFVTDAGKQYVSANSPAPPKLTRSQQRYQAYLDADGELTFGEWVKAATAARQASSC